MPKGKRLINIDNLAPRRREAMWSASGLPPLSVLQLAAAKASAHDNRPPLGFRISDFDTPALKRSSTRPSHTKNTTRA